MLRINCKETKVEGGEQVEGIIATENDDMKVRGYKILEIF